MFFEELEKHGDRIALYTENEERVSYLRLAAHADAFASRLPAGRPLIFIEARPELEAIAAYLGCLRRRCPVYLMAPEAGPSAARAIEVYAPQAVYRKAGANGWMLDTAETATAAHPDLGVLLSTSGTTGSTKLVRLSFGNIDANARQIASYLEIQPEDRAITTLPLSYSYGLSVLNSHLSSGAAVILNADSVTSEKFWRRFKRLGATSFAGVPYTYELLAKVGFAEMELPSLRAFTQAGGHLSRDLVTKFARLAEEKRARFWVMYGQTEATARISYLPPGEALTHPDSIGRAIPEGEIRLLDDEGREIAEEGVAGEMVYDGPNVMMGYASGPEDLGRAADAGPLRTGDVAMRDADGYFTIVGRKRRFIKPFGYRVNLDEIERLARQGGVDLRATGDDSVLVLAVQEPAQEAEARKILVETLGLPPHAFKTLVVPEFPVLPNGKTDYRALLASAGKATTKSALAGGSRGEGIASILVQGSAFLRRFLREAKQLLGVSKGQFKSIYELFQWTFNRKDIDSAQSFKGLGGDSLSYVLIADEIERHLGYLPRNWEAVPVRDLDRLDRRMSAYRRIKTDVLLRAAAIVAIVLNHSGAYVLEGGANILMVLAGLSFARFNWGDDGRDVVRSTLATALKIFAPTLALVLAHQWWWGEIDWLMVLFVKNLIEADFQALIFVWFIQALLQIFLFMALLFSVPQVRRVASRQPFSFGLVFVGLSIGLCHFLVLHGDALLPHRNEMIYTPFYLWQFGMGWLILASRTPIRKLATLLILALGLYLEFYFTTSRTGWLLLGGAALLFVDSVPAPRILEAAASILAKAVFYVFLLHTTFMGALVYFKVLESPLALFAAGLAGGLAAWLIAESARRALRRAEPAR